MLKPKSRYKLYNKDCRDALRTMPPECIDTVICDPPYGLGFMGKDWDHGIPGIGFWTRIMRVCKPGAMLLAFGGTRTHHRLMCAIEDAGWEIRDCMMWMYGSGFPKSHAVGKAVDKAAPRQGMFDRFAKHFAERRAATSKTHKDIAVLFPSKTGGLTGCVWNWENGVNVPTLAQWGMLQPLLSLSLDFLPLVERVEAEREVVGKKEIAIDRWTAEGRKQLAQGKKGSYSLPTTAPATEAAKLWDGYGTALKPAWEIILVAQKPLKNEAVQGIIVRNLLTLEAQLWSLLPAKIAIKTFKLSRADYNAACAFARWSVGKRSSIRDDLFGQMDTLQFVSAMTMILNIVSLWRNILAESYRRVRMSTTSTETDLTTDWKTLDSCVLALTPQSIIRAELQEPGLKLNAVPAARYLNAACASISSTRELSVLGNAISEGHTSLPEGLGLVPNWEPIIVAMKPLEGTFAQNALGHGVAGLNIDGGRVAGPPSGLKPYTRAVGQRESQAANHQNATESHPSGRWPANLLLQHHPECVQVGVKKVKGSKGKADYTPTGNQGAVPITRNVKTGAHFADADGLETIEAWKCHAACPIGMLDRQSGISKSPGVTTRGGRRSGNSGLAELGRQDKVACPSDTGGASRFFYCAKAAKKERNYGLEGLKKKYLATMGKGIGAREHSPDEEGAWVQNNHPTVKPLRIMEYLCLLTRTPTGGIVLDPFMGSGTTGIACARVGRKFIGMENDKEHGYYRVACKRIKEAYREARKKSIAFS